MGGGRDWGFFLMNICFFNQKNAKHHTFSYVWDYACISDL